MSITKKLLCGVGLLLLCLYAAPASAITVDGDLSDWGVTLDLEKPGGTFVDAASGITYDKVKFAAGSLLTAASDVHYDTGDNVLIGPGSEFCDVEGVYWTHDASDLYVAAVTSLDANGQRWNGFGTARFGPGDVRLRNVTTGSDYGLGARPIGLKVYGAIPGVDPDVRDAGTWDDNPPGGWSAGDYLTAFTTAKARVESAPDWYHVDYPGATDEGYFEKASGTFLGYGEALWEQWTDEWTYGDYFEDDDLGYAEPYTTWIFEARVPLSFFDFSEGDIVDVRFFADCANDGLSVPGQFQVVPEPAGLGLLGLALLSLRRRRN